MTVRGISGIIIKKQKNVSAMRKLRTRLPRSGVKLCYGGSTLLTTIGWKIANLKYIKCQIDTQMVRDLSTKQTLHGSNPALY